MSAETLELFIPRMLAAMPGDYSLGVPILDGAVQVGTTTNRSLNAISRLNVNGNEEEVQISRADLVPLQAVAFDHYLGSATSVFSEPVEKLTLARTGNNLQPLWIPIESAKIASVDGLRQFLTVVAQEAHYKKMSSRLSRAL